MLGDTVTTTAGLKNKAGKDQILVSEAIQQAPGTCFQTEPLGTVA